MVDPQRALEILNHLRELGIRLAVDDFGTGQASLGYLKMLPVDELKIDRSFVSAVATDERDAAIVRATVELAHSLGLSVVAEGIEDEETWVKLCDMGCDIAQGFFIARPMPPDELATWLEERRPGSGMQLVAVDLDDDGVALPPA